MQSSSKVILNTSILYGRMVLTVGISFYSTRLILNALGSTDYGIFNLIAGVIAMLAFLNAAMSVSTQRNLAYYKGKNDLKRLREVFTHSLVLHVCIGIIIVMALEISGYFLFDGFLKIPPNRLDTAKVVYHYMSLAVFFTIISVPFTASLYSHENMLWVAIVNTLESILKLGIAIVLLSVSSDKLIMYGLLTALTTVVVSILYSVYCFRKYAECTLKGVLTIERALIINLASFAGWNLFGSLCLVARTQGLAVLLNLFFGATINAAYSIANQVAVQLTFFSVTLLQAINPQIMTSEANNDRERMLRLAMMASKFGFFLLAFIAIPCLFEMRNILNFWLKIVPEYTIIFCSLILVGTLINQFTIGLQSAAQAVGDIKAYQAVVGTLIILNLPIAYLLLKLNFHAYIVFVSFGLIELIACCFRLFFLKKLAGLSIRLYLERVIYKEILPVLLSVITCLIITRYVVNDFRFVFTLGCSIIVTMISIYYFGLCHDEKNILQHSFQGLWKKLKFTNKMP